MTLHQLQHSQGATAPAAIQMGSSSQPIHALPVGSVPSAPLQQPVAQTQQLQLQHTQQTIQQQHPLGGKQNKVTPVSKPAGLDPVIVLQVVQSLVVVKYDMITLFQTFLFA